jgi:hypothetical protein
MATIDSTGADSTGAGAADGDDGDGSDDGGDVVIDAADGFACNMTLVHPAAPLPIVPTSSVGESEDALTSFAPINIAVYKCTSAQAGKQVSGCLI